jgi:hypothetical protein
MIMIIIMIIIIIIVVIPRQTEKYKEMPKCSELVSEHIWTRDLPNKMHRPQPSLFSISPTLEHGTSVKRFVSLQFLVLHTVGRTPCTGDQLVVRKLPTHRATQIQYKRTHRHPCLERDSNPQSQRSRGRESSCLKSRGHCDRHRPQRAL